MGSSITSVRKLDEGAFDRVKLVWTCSCNSLYARMSFNVLREVAGYLGSSLLIVAVTPERILALCVATEECREVFLLPERITVDPGSVYVLLDARTIFVCGCSARQDHPDSSSPVYTITDGVVTEKPDLRKARSGPGLYYHKQEETVYVFGGIFVGKFHSDPLATSEKLMLTENRWGDLSDMTRKRYFFNPAAYDSQVYLCGGHCDVVESFDLRSGDFRICMEISLPPGSLYFNATAVTFNSSLIIYACGKKTAWDFEKHALSVDELPATFNPWSNASPVVAGTTVFFVSALDRVCRGVDLESGAVLLESSFVPTGSYKSVR